jgi:hypothetical protein
MKSLDFSQYRRAFLFGCSFTRYYWPTWADIISKEISETHIYAQVGAGNFYIYQAVIEATLKYHIQENDLVMIMFSNVTREDRYTREKGWITPGNLFFQDTYKKDFLDNFFCEKGYLMRDLSLIEGLSRFLESTKAEVKLMSMISLDSLSGDSNKIKDIKEVLNMYNSTIEKIMPSVFDVVFEGEWNNKEPRPKYFCHWTKDLYTDNHPTPSEHLLYLYKLFPYTKFKKETIMFVEDSTARLLNCTSYHEILESFKNQLLQTESRL